MHNITCLSMHNKNTTNGDDGGTDLVVDDAVS